MIAEFLVAQHPLWIVIPVLLIAGAILSAIVGFVIAVVLGINDYLKEKKNGTSVGRS